jgi:hypothetical protein
MDTLRGTESILEHMLIGPIMVETLNRDDPLICMLSAGRRSW